MDGFIYLGKVNFINPYRTLEFRFSLTDIPAQKTLGTDQPFLGFMFTN